MKIFNLQVWKIIIDNKYPAAPLRRWKDIVDYSAKWVWLIVDEWIDRHTTEKEEEKVEVALNKCVGS